MGLSLRLLFLALLLLLPPIVAALHRPCPRRTPGEDETSMLDYEEDEEQQLPVGSEEQHLPAGSGASSEDDKDGEDESSRRRGPPSRSAKVLALLKHASPSELTAAFRSGDLKLHEVASVGLSSAVPRSLPYFDLDMPQEEITHLPKEDLGAWFDLAEHWGDSMTETLHAKAKAEAEKAAAEEAAAARAEEE